MKKLLAYIGLIEDDGTILPPKQQDNFGKNMFVISSLVIILIPFIIYYTIWLK